ncbi:MAG: hypothetical protein KDD19_15270 [Phaeodactylibacter sp.]|nr:hypothetical protein [Phaeodactylibacter sp.]MCB9050360.1 hypothetical protein [Lewinellaceae bacterium]
MTTPYKVIFPILAFLVLFNACQSGVADKGDEQDFTVQLQCQAISEDDALPQSAVYAIVNQNKVKLATISSCDSIPPASYEDYEIPANALAAAGGWWGGAGDYFYAIREDTVIAFYQGWADESQEDESFHYTRIGAFEDGMFNLQIPVRKEELVGTYALSREAGSYILFVGMKEDSLVAEYFQMDGILPPVNQLNILMSSLERKEAAHLVLNTTTLNFTSELGKGQFLLEKGGAAVVLQEEEVDGHPLRMEKILSKDYSIPVQ